MRLVWKFALPVACVAQVAIFVAPGRSPVPPRPPVPEVVQLLPGSFEYRASGEFTRDGQPAPPPRATITITRPLAIMRHQVTAADYRRCVDHGACLPVDGEAASDRPIVKVSWRDAQAYVAWLSRATAASFRLPTDEEWAYAAASRRADDALPDDAYADPGRRALARYDADTSRAGTLDRGPQPIGSFGANEHGLVDMAGNVWEWTDTCFARVMLDASGETAATLTNCGVRIAAGRHRSYVPDFIRDARGGGCSAGAQPSNLGFRLVRDDDAWRPLRLLLAKAGP